MSLADVPLLDDHVPDVPLTDVHLPVGHPDGWVGEKCTSPRIAFGLESGSRRVGLLCCNLFISGAD
jgi:hypothetical protein